MHKLTIKHEELIGEENGRVVMISQVEIDGAVVQCHIPMDALDNRKAIYGLATDEEALEAIYREIVTNRERLEPDGHEDKRIARMGGLRKGVTIKRTTPPPDKVKIG